MDFNTRPVGGYDRESIKLSFKESETKYVYNIAKGAVTCKIVAHLKVPYPKSPLYWLPVYDLEQSFQTFGVAYCSPENVFDPEIGRKIARARAEDKAYKEAEKRLEKLVKFFADYSLKIWDFFEKSNKCITHNAEYIKSVGDYASIRKEAEPEPSSVDNDLYQSRRESSEETKSYPNDNGQDADGKTETNVDNGNGIYKVPIDWK